MVGAEAPAIRVFGPWNTQVRERSGIPDNVI